MTRPGHRAGFLVSRVLQERKRVGIQMRFQPRGEDNFAINAALPVISCYFKTASEMLSKFKGPPRKALYFPCSLQAPLDCTLRVRHENFDGRDREAVCSWLIAVRRYLSSGAQH
jgi:hypothetical protein